MNHECDKKSVIFACVQRGGLPGSSDRHGSEIATQSQYIMHGARNVPLGIMGKQPFSRFTMFSGDLAERGICGRIYLYLDTNKDMNTFMCVLDMMLSSSC